MLKQKSKHEHAKAEVGFSQEADDPGWEKLAEEVGTALELEYQEALAHLADQKRFTLANPTEFQKEIQQLAKAAPADRRQKALADVVDQTNEPETKRKQRLGRLAAVKLGEKTPVPRQIEVILEKEPPRISKKMLDELFDGDAATKVKEMNGTAGGLKAAAPLAAAASKPFKLEIQLLEVKVHNKNDLIGKDEVYFGGYGILVDGKVKKVDPFKVGKLKQGQKKSFDPPKRVCEYDLNRVPSFPKHGGFNVMMAEHDFGHGHEKAVEKAVDKIRDYLTTALKKAATTAGIALGTLLGSPQFGAIIGNMLGKVFGFILKKIADWVKKLFGDDLLKAEFLKFQVKSTNLWNGAKHGPNHKNSIHGKGTHYEITWRWALAG